MVFTANAGARAPGGSGGGGDAAAAAAATGDRGGGSNGNILLLLLLTLLIHLLAMLTFRHASRGFAKTGALLKGVVPVHGVGVSVLEDAFGEVLTDAVGARIGYETAGAAEVAVDAVGALGAGLEGGVVKAGGVDAAEIGGGVAVPVGAVVVVVVAAAAGIVVGVAVDGVVVCVEEGVHDYAGVYGGGIVVGVHVGAGV